MKLCHFTPFCGNKEVLSLVSPAHYSCCGVAVLLVLVIISSVAVLLVIVIISTVMICISISSSNLHGSLQFKIHELLMDFKNYPFNVIYSFYLIGIVTENGK